MPAVECLHRIDERRQPSAILVEKSQDEAIGTARGFAREILPERLGRRPARHAHAPARHADAPGVAGKDGGTIRRDDVPEKSGVSLEELAGGGVGAEQAEVQQRRRAIAKDGGCQGAGELLRNPHERRPGFRSQGQGRIVRLEREREGLPRVRGLDERVDIEAGAGQVGPPPGLPFTLIGLQPIGA